VPTTAIFLTAALSSGIEQPEAVARAIVERLAA
jgi:hypothetical protein